MLRVTVGCWPVMLTGIHHHRAVTRIRHAAHDHANLPRWCDLAFRAVGQLPGPVDPQQGQVCVCHRQQHGPGCVSQGGGLAGHSTRGDITQVGMASPPCPRYG